MLSNSRSLAVRITTLLLLISFFTFILFQPGLVFARDDIFQPKHNSYPEPLLLPDLKTLPPSDLRLVVNTGAGTKSLRFSNHILNRGPGILEMSGQFEAETGVVHVTQKLYGRNFFSTEKETGIFYYHESHSHWHWEGFSEYRIWSVTSSGVLGDLLASNDKVGYCLEDVEVFEGDAAVLDLGDNPDIAAGPQFSSCFWRRQGLSIGWVDIYRSHLPGQSIDISHLKDGVYALQSTVDPDNLIWESNDLNNSSIAYFSLSDDRLDTLKHPPTLINPAYSSE